MASFTPQPTPSATRGGVFAPLAAITPRGRVLLVVAVIIAMLANVLGQKDLLRAAVLLALLPLVSAAVAVFNKVQMVLTRSIQPIRTTPGKPVQVELELLNLRHRPSPIMLIEEQLPASLAKQHPQPRYVVGKLPGQQKIQVNYPLSSRLRGWYEVGPLAYTVTDPLGLCELTKVFTPTNRLIVHPVVKPLQQIPGGGKLIGYLEAKAQAAPTGTERDLITREYRHGDDIRRVHWRSTARRGQLMVRREQQPPHAHATIVLDLRRNAHAGQGEHSSLEWAVSAAASIAVHLAKQNYSVRIQYDTQPAVWRSAREVAVDVLDQLAGVELGDEQILADSVATIANDRNPGLIIAVVGSSSADESQILAPVMHRDTMGYALLLRSSHWGSAAPAESSRIELQRAGWNVVECSPTDTVAVSWNRLVKSSRKQAGS